MTLSDSRTIPCDRRNNPERLLRAAVYAFCSLTRPTRNEIVQLDDLALPILDATSMQTRRYLSAALSECPSPPPGLVRRLCEESVDVCAPLLVKSSALSNIDLLALIGRHGMGHARAIARRRGLDPKVAELISSLEAIEGAKQAPALPEPENRLEETRRRLRAMMEPANPDALSQTGGEELAPGYDELLAAALAGVATIFQRRLAEALGISLAQARALTRESGREEFVVALRALDLVEEQAFILAACVFGRHFTHAEVIRIFIERYRAMSRAMARSVIRAWRESAGLDRAEPGALPEVAELKADNQAGARANGFLRVS